MKGSEAVTLRNLEVVVGTLERISAPSCGAVVAKIVGKPSTYNIALDEEILPHLETLKGQPIAVSRIDGRDHVARWPR